MVASFHLAIQDEERVKGLNFSMKILQSLDNDVKALLQPAQGGNEKVLIPLENMQKVTLP